MQRRAAAAYVAFFLILGTASYSLIATASTPAVGFENPEHELTQGESFTIDGQEYTVGAISASESEGEISRSSAVTWTEESARYTWTWERNGTITFEGTDYQVLIPESDDPSRVTLSEAIDREALLANDTSAQNETISVDGTDYVVVTENGERTLVPAEEYFPEPETRAFAEGDQFDYNGNATTVETVTGEAATLAWTAPRERSADLADGSNVTLAGQTYLAHFPDNETVVVTQQFERYDAQTEQVDEHHERINGLWGVSILSAVAAVLLIGMAYLPTRY